MKARKVKQLDPGGTLADNAERILRARLDELYSFDPQVCDPAEVEALHDMRIAAKRLRYLLELAGPAFGPEAVKAAKVAKELQEVLGEIHDCDEMLPLVEGEVGLVRDEDARALVARAAPDAADLEPAAAAEGPHRALYRGLEVLAAYTQARREVLYRQFLRRWRELERDRFRDRLGDTLARRAVAAGPPRALPASAPAPPLPGHG